MFVLPFRSPRHVDRLILCSFPAVVTYCTVTFFAHVAAPRAAVRRLLAESYFWPQKDSAKTRWAAALCLANARCLTELARGCGHRCVRNGAVTRRRELKPEIFPIGSGAQLLSAYVLLKNC
eukprot:COSAG02_NODE_532_length_20668_cov_28.281832_2_plen_121_part_00